MKHRSFILIAAGITASLLLTLFGSSLCRGQNLNNLIQSEEDVYYMLHISGTANNEHFSNVNAVLHLGLPAHLSTNPYTITITGFPQANTRNSFFWNSNEGAMQVFGTDVTMISDSSRTGGLSANHFFYLSPVLLEVPRTHREKELRQQAERDALPTRIYATYGEIEITFTGNRVHGSVMLNGRDPIGRDFVLYQATFSGETTTERPPQF